MQNDFFKFLSSKGNPVPKKYQFIIVTISMFCPILLLDNEDTNLLVRFTFMAILYLLGYYIAFLFLRNNKKD